MGMLKFPSISKCENIILALTTFILEPTFLMWSPVTVSDFKRFVNNMYMNRSSWLCKRDYTTPDNDVTFLHLLQARADTNTQQSIVLIKHLCVLSFPGVSWFQ